MVMMIDPPVNVFSSVDAVRDWIVDLAGMRERYRDDHEALRRITRGELYASRLLELIPMLPKVAAPHAGQYARERSWDARTPFDRMMDEIVAATSVREDDHLWLEVRRDFAGDPRLPELETVLGRRGGPDQG